VGSAALLLARDFAYVWRYLRADISLLLSVDQRANGATRGFWARGAVGSTRSAPETRVPVIARIVIVLVIGHLLRMDRDGHNSPCGTR
jgi:hypothetical protein